MRDGDRLSRLDDAARDPFSETVAELLCRRGMTARHRLHAELGGRGIEERDHPEDRLQVRLEDLQCPGERGPEVQRRAQRLAQIQQHRQLVRMEGGHRHSCAPSLLPGARAIEPLRGDGVHPYGVCLFADLVLPEATPAPQATVFVVDAPVGAERKTNVTRPRRTSSPSLRETGSAIRFPRTNVPFLLPRSSTSTPEAFHVSRGRLRSGESVLVQGAGAGTSTFAVPSVIVPARRFDPDFDASSIEPAFPGSRPRTSSGDTAGISVLPRMRRGGEGPAPGAFSSA